MSTKNNKHVLFLIVLFFFLFLGEASNYHVYVINIMKSNVTIHCKSKDDDLGVHVLSYGKPYEWSFNVNFWKTTLFFCGFISQYGSGVYDIFRADRDLGRCRICLWEVREDGVHGFKDNASNDDLWFKWQ
ncbi:Self-incomp_S1 domain-containing protein [Cephalotus follicularis]|uniref:S-protein homolog n=1 Tax=Cephalotus follicularis TaxID=3775 RepID=A0A1Q3CHE6_CEPFO|nr:Self-incomp_S1 domain-containing protein [Cephalotus follicularis]